MAKELKYMLKADLIALVEKQKKTIDENVVNKGLISDLKEENRLLMIQLEEDSDAVDVNVPVTTPKAKKKKLADMGEFEAAQHLRLTTSRKVL